MTYQIDWTKPIEAYHEDGRVVQITDIQYDGCGDWYSEQIPERRRTYFGENSGIAGGTGWRIRNRKSDKPLCVDTPDWAVRKAIGLWPKPNAWTPEEVKRRSDETGPAAIITFARYIATHEEPPKDRAETLVEEWGADPLSAAVARDFARWLEDNGHLKDEP